MWRYTKMRLDFRAVDPWCVWDWMIGRDVKSTATKQTRFDSYEPMHSQYLKVSNFEWWSLGALWILKKSFRCNALAITLSTGETLLTETFTLLMKLLRRLGQQFNGYRSYSSLFWKPNTHARNMKHQCDVPHAQIAELSSTMALQHVTPDMFQDCCGHPSWHTAHRCSQRSPWSLSNCWPPTSGGKEGRGRPSKCCNSRSSVI